MAHKKAGGSTRNGRDSNPNYHGVKRYGGQVVQAGEIIVRQTGNKFHAGVNAGLGKDFTIYALTAGRVKFEKRGLPLRQYVTIVPEDAAETVH